MMTTDEWLQRWNLPLQALHELLMIPVPEQNSGDQSESAVQSQIRLNAAQCGQRLWRNNTGAATDASGRPIRYGLGNDSKKVNEEFKSSDLIGITSVAVTPQMIGQTVGIFTAVECKPNGWKLIPSDKRGAAQSKFLHVVRQSGGIGIFATDVEDYKKCIIEHV